MKTSLLSIAAVVALSLSACGAATKEGKTSDNSSSLAASRDQKTPAKSGFVQYSLLTCTVPADAQLPDSLEFPSKFEVFFDAYASQNASQPEIAATVLLEIPDVRIVRVLAEGVLKQSGDGTIQVTYNSKKLGNTTNEVVITTEGAAAEKATLKIGTTSVAYSCKTAD